MQVNGRFLQCRSKSGVCKKVFKMLYFTQMMPFHSHQLSETELALDGVVVD